MGLGPAHPVPMDLDLSTQLAAKLFLFLSIAEKGPGAWDQDLSTQLAAKILIIDSNAGQIPHPDRYNIRDLAYFYCSVVDPDPYSFPDPHIIKQKK